MRYEKVETLCILLKNPGKVIAVLLTFFFFFFCNLGMGQKRELIGEEQM